VRDATHVPATRSARQKTRELLSRALVQIARDEEHAQRDLGVNYRRECLSAWPVQPIEGTLQAPAAMPRLWRELAQMCHLRHNRFHSVAHSYEVFN
jgi:hypothetical protein